ncbi:uncharacterized transporter slc-17.2-like [Haliotis cracherodii]|uniref:uncharacterized transporter slc-17.2-like n=1 Tax=Haliotis cracherodii TaxID=6455 RepID=UPI0039EA9C4E
MDAGECSVSARDLPDVRWYKSRRYLIAVILFLGFSLQNTLRSNLSIAIVCMVRHDVTNTSLTDVNGSSYWVPGEQCRSWRNQGVNETEDELQGEFTWSKELQGVLLGGSFWGCLGMLISGGWLSERFGATKVIALGMIPTAIATILSPAAARISPYFLLFLRITVGFFSSVVFPSIPVFWARWAPPDEWMKLLGFSLSGGETGNAYGHLLNGFLCRYGFVGGWPSIFYVTGGVCLLWCIVWPVIVSDSPRQCRWISDTERRYIEWKVRGRLKSKRKQSTPWLSLLRSRPVWALVLTHTTANFFLYLLFTQLPSYLNEVTGVNFTSNGVYSMLPYVCMIIVINVASHVSDWLIHKVKFTVRTTRRLMNSLGMFGSGAMVIILAQAHCGWEGMSVSTLCLTMGAFGFCFCGHISNFADITLAHSGTLAGVSDTIATLSGIAAPYVVSTLTPNRTREEWQKAFYVAAGVSFAGGLIFALFSDGKPQPWDVHDLSTQAVKRRHDGDCLRDEELDMYECDVAAADDVVDVRDGPLETSARLLSEGCGVLERGQNMVSGDTGQKVVRGQGHGRGLVEEDAVTDTLLNLPKKKNVSCRRGSK